MDDYKVKYEAAKELVKQLDRQVAKYEASGVDELLDSLEEYELLGTPDDIKNKLESKGKNEGDDVSELEDLKTEVEALRSQLAKYQELGSIDEIEELMKSYEVAQDEKDEAKKKVESIVDDLQYDRAKLESYEAIGTIGEIHDLIDDYSDIKQKVESQRISQELGISIDKVQSTIDKVESVSQAETLLRDLFKGESRTNSNYGDSNTDEDYMFGHGLRRHKYESSLDEKARIVGSTDKLSRLRQVMDRL